MLSNIIHYSYENPPEEYEEKYFDECYADELRYLKKYPEKDICDDLVKNKENDLPF